MTKHCDLSFYSSKLETVEIFVFLRSIVINLSTKIRFRVIYKNYVIFFLYLSFGLSFSGANAKQNNVLFWHKIRLTRRGIMKQKQHLQSFLSVCNKRLLSATARHARKRPSEQFAASFLRTIYLKKKRGNFTQEQVLLS